MRLFILGHAPLPVEKNIENQTAYGLRTWQFLSILPKFPKAKIVLVTDQVNEHGKREELEIFGEKTEVLKLHKDKKCFWKKLRKEFKDFNPEACLGVNNFASFCLAKLKPKVPFWADLNGWIMGEAQSQAFVHQNNSYVPTLWHRERTILQEADAFSTVSTPQKHALLGELASIGRLTAETENWRFAVTIGNANELGGQKAKLLDLKLPKDAFMILFSGSYNSWLDEEMLFWALEAAIEKNPKIHFVSTGRKKTIQTKHPENFHFLGWLEKKELISCYEQADLAINVDRTSNETTFGARNRINEWIEYEVPVISTIGTEITQELDREKLIIGVEMGNQKDLTEKILKATEQDLKEMAKAAKKYMSEKYSYKETSKELLTWMKAPKKAPDSNRLRSFKPSLIQKIKFRLKKDGLGFLLKHLREKIF